MAWDDRLEKWVDETDWSRLIARSILVIFGMAVLCCATPWPEPHDLMPPGGDYEPVHPEPRR